MKPLSTALCISLLGTMCYGAEPAAPASQAAAADQETAAASQAAAAGPEAISTAKQLDSAEVVSADAKSGTLTFKNEGDEQTAPVEGKAAIALKVVRPGDKVRILYHDADNSGIPDRITGVIITKPASTETTQARTERSETTSEEQTGTTSEKQSETTSEKQY